MRKIKTLKQLKKKWRKEREYYKDQELGSGVHSFVRDFLECEDTLSLTEGSLSTNLESREEEYIHENKAEEGRQADFVIYLNSQIIIPVEAKCYGNIGEGVEQLFRYQKDFDKQYGILTDGYTWRFYNNNDYQSFNLNNIFKNTERFLDFWNEYIKPENYYLSFFEPSQQRKLLESTDVLQVEDKREIFFDDITNLIGTFKNKLQLEGYLNNSDKEDTEKRAVEITYAYIIQFILYKTLADNDFRSFKEEYDTNIGKIYEYLDKRRYKDILGIVDCIASQISENIYKPFSQEQKYINSKLKELYREVENTLSEVSPWLEILRFIKKYSFLNVQSEIFGYIYENYLKELYGDKKRGQNFTDPAVVDFMVKQIGFRPETLRERYSEDEDSISLIDPACGSGTFLYSAVNRVLEAFGGYNKKHSEKVEEIVNNNIFGSDIAEFPLYLAEMNIIMRMLPIIMGEKYNNPIDKKIKVFKTKDSVAEFLDTDVHNTLYDQNIELQETEGSRTQQALFEEKLDLGYKSYVREENDLNEMKESLEEKPRIPRRRFDYVIGNPPYISYNKCSKEEVVFFQLMKEGEAKLSDVYGVNLHSVPGDRKKYPPKPNIYAFFVALGIALLKDHGKLSYIIPQTMLTASDLDVLRYHLAEYTTIEKIITFPNALFVGRGLEQKRKVPTSSLIFVLNKENPSEGHEVQIINYQDSEEKIAETFENIEKGVKTEKKKIAQSKLLDNYSNWNYIKLNKELINFHKEYDDQNRDISIYYNHTQAEEKFESRFYFDVGFTLGDEEVIEKKPEEDFYELLDFTSFKGFSGLSPNKYYPADEEKITLTKNSQGYATLDKKYKIVWRVKNPVKFHYTTRPIIFKMGQSGIICSDNQKEILYLFSILNSPISKLIFNINLKSKGEKELQVPIKAVKKYIKVPKITEKNNTIKKEIVQQTEEVLNLEDKTLDHFVDFSGLMVQKFDDINVEAQNLILEVDNKFFEAPIHSKQDLVTKTVKEKFIQSTLIEENRRVTLSELKTFPIIDLEKQQQLINYIDDLIFSLYFGVSLKEVELGLENSEVINKICSANPYYDLLDKVDWKGS